MQSGIAAGNRRSQNNRPTPNQPTTLSGKALTAGKKVNADPESVPNTNPLTTQTCLILHSRPPHARCTPGTHISMSRMSTPPYQPVTNAHKHFVPFVYFVVHKITAQAPPPLPLDLPPAFPCNRMTQDFTGEPECNSGRAQRAGN